MKKLSLLMVVLFLLFSINLKAQLLEEEEEEELIQKRADDWSFLIGMHGGFGVAYAGGAFIDSVEPKIGYGYALNLEFGYQIPSFGAIIVGIEYAQKMMGMLSKDDASSTYVYASFFDIILGYRYVYDWFYWEVGGFYGLKVGTWENEVFDGNGNSVAQGSLEDKLGYNEIGAYFGMGIAIALTNEVNLDIGIKYEISFVDGYRESADDPNSLKSRLGMIYTGFSFKN
ncbi:MAG: hypothetical protein GY754_26150 [bacterium]|nr:hypothetical protein [bacterium]